LERYLASLAVVLLAMAALPAACQDSAPTSAAPTDYRIAPEDVLQIDVWGEPDLEKIQVQVTPDGKIHVPYIGPMHVQGKTQQQVANDIAEAFVKEELLVSPKVNITLLSMHRPTVRVLGQVGRPGLVEFKEGDTIMEAIAQAGSYTADAYLEKATLTRKDSTEPIPVDLKALFYKGDMSQNLKLEKGDTIYIPEDTVNKYYVLGEVMRPGLFQLRENVTVLSAVMAAGGPTPRGKMKGTMLIRGDIKNPQKVPVNLAELIDKGDVKQDIPLEPGDVVYVPESNKPDWNKVSTFLSALISVGYLRRYGLF